MHSINCIHFTDILIAYRLNQQKLISDRRTREREAIQWRDNQALGGPRNAAYLTWVVGSVWTKVATRGAVACGGVSVQSQAASNEEMGA
jgi:hypothetical protein